MFKKIKMWFGFGLWNADMVNAAVGKGILTQAQADEIMGR